MPYQPRHKAVRPTVVGRRAMGAVMTSAATVGAGLATSSHAEAATASNVWDRVAACESTSNWSINTGNGFYGGLQFTAQTWRGFGGTQYAAYANQATRAQQIAIAQKVLKVQGPGAWPVCSKRAGLTLATGLAASGGSTGSSSSGSSSSSSGSSSSTSSSTTSRSSSRGLVLDGIAGPLTTRSTQNWLGIRRDGASALNARTIAALQARIGTSQDGVVGPKTTRALQRYLGISQDGSSTLNGRTVRALQSFLNAKGM